MPPIVSHCAPTAGPFRRSIRPGDPSQNDETETSSPRRLLLVLHFTDPSGERRTLWSGLPRCQSEAEIPSSIEPALAWIRRERGTAVKLDVVDDVTAACVWSARIKPENRKV